MIYGGARNALGGSPAHGLPGAGLVIRSGVLGQRPGLTCALAVTVLVSIALAGVAFGRLIDAIQGDGWHGTAVDLALSELTAQHRAAWSTALMRQVTDLGSTAALASVALGTIVVTLLRRRYRLATTMLLASVGSSVLTVSMKSIIARPRPETNDEIIRASDFSFPSGHTLESAAIYGALVFVIGSLLVSRRARIGVWFGGAVLAVAIGVSRVYLGVHWTSDVAAGWLLGLTAVVVSVGLVSLDQRVTRHLGTGIGTGAPRMKALSTRTSVLGMVGLAAATVFVAGYQIPS